MGSDVYEGTEGVPSPRAIKVHRPMCTELIKLVNRVSEMFPEIEAARPRCSSGIEALCLLNNAIVKAKLLLRHCAESSKLYLALTGDVILSRCNKSRNLLELGLTQMQNMVPLLLAAKMSQVASDLRNASFSLDPHEEDVGKVLLDLLHQYGSAKCSTEETALKAIQIAAVRLHISSQKALLIEKRSIKKQLDDVGQSCSQKRNILVFFQMLLKKYGSLIVKEQKEDVSLQQYVEVESCHLGLPNQAPMGMLEVHSAPEEFKCPLSLGLMYDPVIIASGQTFERMWIQKWFDEGHDSCPRTRIKLTHLTLTPNTNLKDLIAKWCSANNVTLSDPSLPVKRQPLDSSSSSISSLSSSMADLSLPLDISNLSVGSSDARQDSDSSHSTIPTNSDTMSVESCQGFDEPVIDVGIPSEFDSLPLELRCKFVKDIENSLNRGDHFCSLTSCKSLALNISKFLKESHDYHDVEAQKNGCLLLLAFLRNCRRSISFLGEEMYGLLASFLDSNVAKESLAIFEELSCHDIIVDEIAASGTLVHILQILTRDITRLQEPAFKILHKFSANSNIRSFIMPSEFVPVLLPLLENSTLASFCVAIIENLCYSKDFRVFVAETDGCITSIAKLLESDCYSDQEHAVGVLLSLCCQHVQYCKLILDEGVIPALVAISNRGTCKGKAMATELLRLLREEVADSEESCRSDFRDSKENGNLSKERKHSSKATGMFSKMSIFSKRSSLASSTRR